MLTCGTVSCPTLINSKRRMCFKQALATMQLRDLTEYFSLIRPTFLSEPMFALTAIWTLCDAADMLREGS